MSRSHCIYQLNRRTALLLLCSVVVLLGLNLLLVKQNKELKAYAQTGERNLALKPGTQLPPIEGHGPDGNRMRFDFASDRRKTLVMVFSPNCSACRENMPNWQAIIGRVDQQAYRLVGISLAAKGTREYVEENQLRDMSIVAEIDAKTRVAYNLLLSPQLILIDANGNTEKVWSGVLDSDDKREVEGLLHVELGNRTLARGGTR